MTKGPNPVDVDVGSRVRTRRLKLRMSQEKLADAIGLTFQQVQKYEKGTNRMGASRLLQVATVLAVPVSYFFQDTLDRSKSKGKAPSFDYVAKFVSNEGGHALMKAFMQIKDVKLRRSIVRIVNELAGPET